MWLRVSFFPDRPSVLAAVGADGNVYFMAADVGRFLGYRDAYKFSRAYGTKNLLDFVPLDRLPGRFRAYKNGVPALDFADLAATARKTLRRHKLPLDERRLSRMTALWYFGSAADDLPPGLSDSPERAGSLRVGPRDQTRPSVREWLREFAGRVRESFAERRSTGLDENHSMDASPKTVENLTGLDENYSMDDDSTGSLQTDPENQSTGPESLQTGPENYSMGDVSTGSLQTDPENHSVETLQMDLENHSADAPLQTADEPKFTDRSTRFAGESVKEATDECFEMTLGDLKFVPDRLCIKSGREKYTYALRENAGAGCGKM